MNRCRTTRTGMTLLEVVAVMVVMVILGAVLLPAIGGVRGDTRQRAAVDTFTARVADGRIKAMEQGRPFQLAVHQDGRRLRLAAFAADPTTDPDVVEDTLADTVAATIVSASDASAQYPDDAGWLTVATFRPDGSCREDNVLVQVAEPGNVPLFVHLRGITGVVTVHTNDPTLGAL